MNRLLFLFGLFPCVALSSTQTVGLSSELVSVALSLLMVVLLIIGLGFFLKKLNPNIGNNSDFKVVRSLPLGTKERLLVVEIDGKQLLLGVTPQHPPPPHTPPPPPAAPPAPAFAKELSRFLTMNHKNNKNTSDD